MDTVAADVEVKKKIKKKKANSNLIVNLIGTSILIKDTQYSVVKKVVKGMLGMKVIR